MGVVRENESGNFGKRYLPRAAGGFSMIVHQGCSVSTEPQCPVPPTDKLFGLRSQMAAHPPLRNGAQFSQTGQLDVPFDAQHSQLTDDVHAHSPTFPSTTTPTHSGVPPSPDDAGAQLPDMGLLCRLPAGVPTSGLNPSSPFHVPLTSDSSPGTADHPFLPGSQPLQQLPATHRLASRLSLGVRDQTLRGSPPRLSLTLLLQAPSILAQTCPQLFLSTPHPSLLSPSTALNFN